MKINEITEAPVGGFAQAAQSIGSKVLGKVPGMKSKAANLAGKADLAATANNLYNQFMTFLGTQNKTDKQADTQDVIDFLDSKNVDTGDIDTAQPMTIDRINKIFMAKATQAMRGKGAKPATAQPPASAGPDSSAKASSQYAQVKNAALKLSTKERNRLIAALGKGAKQKAVPQFKSSREPTAVDKNFDKNQKLSQFGAVGR
jgi:hypothetical protein